MIKGLRKIWNDNFNKGVSVFQMFLMGTMIIGAIFNNSILIMFSMIVCLFGYFEFTDYRYSPNTREVKS